MTFLNINTIENITQQVLPKDCSYEIKKSETSNSVYLRLIYTDMDTTIRFSDHITTKSNVKTVLIKQSTKQSLIANTITKTIKNLKLLSLNIKLGVIK